MKKIFSIIAMLALALNICAQSSTEQAKTYFSKYMSKQSIMELIFKSLPTLQDCKKVFKEADAETYFKYVETMKAKQPSIEDEKFVDVGIEIFTTEDIVAGKQNYAGGMKSIEARLQPKVTFYKVELLRTAGAEMGMAYKYWVNLNGNWIYFPKPWNAFESK